MVYSPNKYRETEGIKVRRLGYALDVATLQQVAYNHGIYESVQNMTQAQKSQIRYIAIMEQSANAMNDMARTIESPANQMRIFEQRIDQFKRAVGNGLMPIVSAALPYLTAFVRILTEAAQSLADFLGFEIPQFNYGDIVAESNKGIASSFDDATAAAKTFKGTLSSIDQLNIIGSHKEKSGAGDLTNPYDLDLDLPSYDFLDGLSESADDVYNKMKKVFSGIVGFVKEALPYVAAFGAAFVGIKLGTLLTQLPKLAGAFGGLFTSWSAWKTTVAASASSFVLLFNSVKNLTKGTGNLKNNIAQLAVGLGIAGTAIAGFIKFGNPVGAVITGIAAAIGVVTGLVSAEKELEREVAKTAVFDNLGISIADISKKYTDLTAKMTETSDKILDNQGIIDQNKELISSAGDVISSVGEEFRTTGNLTEEAAQKIQQAAQDISSSVSSNLSLSLQNSILAIGDNWDTVAQKAGAAKDEVIGAFYAAQQQGNTILANLQQEIDAATSTLLTADKGSAEYQSAQEKFNKYTSKLYEIQAAATSGKNSEVSALQFDLSQLDASKISLMDANTALEELKKIYDAQDSAFKSLDSAKAAFEEQLTIDQATYKALGVELPESYLEGIREGARENYNSTITELYEQTKSISDALQQRINQLKSDALSAADYQRYNSGKVGVTLGTFFSEAAGNVADWFTGGNQDERRHDKLLEDIGMNEILEEANKLQSSLNAKGIEIGAEGFDAGMEQGIDEGKDRVHGAAWAVSKGTITKAREALDSHSPSRLSMEIGNDFDEGFRLGILRGEHDVFSTIREFGERVSALFQSYMPDFGVYAEQASASFSKIYQPKTSYSYAAQTAPAVQSAGYDPRAVTEAAQLWGSVDRPIDVNVQLNSVVELDGDQVGQAVTNYQNGRVIASNGMAK